MFRPRGFIFRKTVVYTAMVSYSALYMQCKLIPLVCKQTTPLLISNFRRVLNSCNLSFGWFPGVWILYTDVSEHSLSSIFIGGVSMTQKIQTPGNRGKNSSCSHLLWRLNRVPKRRKIKFRRRGIAQKKEYDTLYLTCIYSRLPEDEPSGSKHVEGIRN